jgi:uncharacterized protein
MKVKTDKGEYIIDKLISLINPTADIKQYYKLGILNEPAVRSADGAIIKLSKGDVENRLSNTNQLILEVTQDCNLRCEYCVHAGMYKGIRTHRPVKMAIKTAKKSIDYYLLFLFSKRRTRKLNDVWISFYGGEALLEKEMIFEVIDYAKKKIDGKFDILFRLNTNGLLLKSDIVDKLVHENIKIDISFDGPEDQHDKFRKLKSGEGSWKYIMENVKYIKETYPSFYKANIKFQLTMHPYHDVKAIQDYFLETSDFFNVDNLIINNFRLDDRLNVSKSEYDEFISRQIFFRKEVDQHFNKKKWFYWKYDIARIETNEVRKPTRIHGTNMTYTGTCSVVEDQMFVNSQGKIKLCVKAPEFFIGDVYNGVDIDFLIDLDYRWKKEILKSKCWECKIKFLCPQCFEKGLDEKTGELCIRKERCNAFISSTLNKYSDYFNYQEMTSVYSEENFNDFMESI